MPTKAEVARIKSGRRGSARMRWCEKCDRFTAQVPWSGRKYKWLCCRCGKPQEEILDEHKD